MSKHTPGPWHYGGIENVYAYHQGPHGFLHSRVVALVPAAELEGGEDERRANARLIAAAPELLAVSHAIKMARDMGIPSSEILDPKGEVGKALDVAIAKATGGAQ